MKIHVCDLPEEFHLGVVAAEPRLHADLFLVEHKVHQNVLASHQHCANSSGADLYFVPFYPSCLYAANSYSIGHDVASPSKLARLASDHHVHRSFARMMRIITARPEWKRHGGRDHVFVFGQGRGANIGYIWPRFHRKLRNACLLAVEGRPYGNNSAFNASTDIVIPGYLPWVDEIEQARSASSERDLKIHFRGRAWGGTRPAMFRHITAGPDVLVTSEIRFELGTEGKCPQADHIADYYRELARTEFALCPAGWTPWSRRIYEAILVGSIPVLIPGDFVPPFKEQLDWSRFSITAALTDLATLQADLRAIPTSRVQAMHTELDKVRPHFVYHQRPNPGDAGSTVLAALEKRVNPKESTRSST